jgi:predicted 3-demethylubiquinone-9 3-methyltransferase (glyoxalase superfamily)
MTDPREAAEITPCLWFDGNAEAAARFYAAQFPNSRVDAVHRGPGDYPAGKAGAVLMVEFTLMGRPFHGPQWWAALPIQ